MFLPPSLSVAGGEASVLGVPGRHRLCGELPFAHRVLSKRLTGDPPCVDSSR